MNSQSKVVADKFLELLQEELTAGEYARTAHELDFDLFLDSNMLMQEAFEHAGEELFNADGYIGSGAVIVWNQAMSLIVRGVK